MITGTRYRLTLEINRQLSLARDIERAQIDISTGKRIQGPSDDPVAAARVSDIARAQADNAAYTLNLRTAEAISARADTVLGSAGITLDRVNELMLRAASDTTSADNRATIALELRSLAEELESLKNSRDPRGEPLFPLSTLDIPVGPGLSVQPVGTRAATWETVATAGGPRDMIAIVRAAADAVLLTDKGARSAAVQTAIGEVDAAAAHVSTARGEQGARGNRIDNLVERLASEKLQAEEERTALEGTNVIETAAKLQSRLLTLQAAQAAFTRVNQSTLFDLLR